jgi:hypothetical protein
MKINIEAIENMIGAIIPVNIHQQKQLCTVYYRSGLLVCALRLRGKLPTPYLRHAQGVSFPGQHPHF